jgi:EpsI family protein
MVLGFFALNYLSHAENTPPARPFSQFPKKIGPWEGREDRFDDRVYQILGVDDSILANYRSPGGRQVQLYVGYYQSQREGDLIHSPKNCMPGAGWNILGSSHEEIDVPGKTPARIRAIKLLLAKGADRQVVLYWFQSRGRFIASEYWQKIYLVVDSITRQRTDGSFVRLIAPVLDGDEKETTETLKAFAALAIPVLEEFIPS